MEAMLAMLIVIFGSFASLGVGVYFRHRFRNSTLVRSGKRAYIGLAVAIMSIPLSALLVFEDFLGMLVAVVFFNVAVFEFAFGSSTEG